MANMYGLKKSGITETTPKSLMLGAGTIYKNLKWNENKWEGTIFGATSGGNSLKITPDIVTVDVDGATVKVKGFTHKQGETAELKINLVEITKDSLKLAMIGEEVETDATGFTRIDTKSNIEDKDYIENVAFVGFLVDNSPVIVIMDNALCTSGLEMSGKNKDTCIIPCTFEPYAGFEDGDVQDKLPIHVYVPTAG